MSYDNEMKSKVNIKVVHVTLFSEDHTQSFVKVFHKVLF